MKNPWLYFIYTVYALKAVAHGSLFTYIVKTNENIRSSKPTNMKTHFITFILTKKFCKERSNN